MGLTNKQSAFCREYVIDFNATQAAIRSGYSATTARNIGHNLCALIHIQEGIQRLITEKSMGRDEVLTRLADMARGDVSDLMELTTTGFTYNLLITNEDGTRRPNPKTKLIRKIKQKVTTYLSKSEDGEDREIIETEIELHDQQAALALLGKYHGLFVDRTDITSGGKRIRVNLTGEDDSAA